MCNKAPEPARFRGLFVRETKFPPPEGSNTFGRVTGTDDDYEEGEGTIL